MRARRLVAVCSISTVLALASSPGLARAAFHGTGSPALSRVDQAWWQRRVDALVGGAQVSVTIGDEGAFWYQHLATVPRIPASNEKLLLSMALLASIEPDRMITTRAMAPAEPVDGVLDSDLWLVGHGDPEVTRTTLDLLAEEVRSAGIMRVTGAVIGDTGPFNRDWWAEGWKDYFTADEVPFPTALTFRGNVGPEGRHIDDPELRAASYLTKALRRRGIEVVGDASMGTPQSALVKIATASSAKLIEIVRRMDVDSINFDAEVLGKLLGFETSGTGSIDAAAEAIDAFTSANGAPRFEHHDSSGLSYANRVTTKGIVRLLWSVDEQPWAHELRFALPTGGQGTLEGRLGHLRVRAKTGTLSEISALSGWVWSTKTEDWVSFSILSSGLSKDEAVRIEDAIVALVSERASPPR
jgi:D-alanyl-D-alanine carboxypeptidase/D-alanyl-D-alanine-endopeptidase (penicillin-binding protein 4)